MLRKAAFIFIAVFLAQYGTDIQTYTAIIVLTCAYAAHVMQQPYTKPILQSLEMHSLVTSLVTMQLGLFLFSGSPTLISRIILSFTLLFMNAFFVGRASHLILKEHYYEYLTKYDIKARVASFTNKVRGLCSRH